MRGGPSGGGRLGTNIEGRFPLLRRIAGERGGGGFLLFGAMTAVDVSNFLFHVLISRILGPSSYGALGALLGLLLVLQVPIGAMQVAITQEVAARRDAAGGTMPHLLIGRLVGLCVVVSVIG